jgi:hypothetical protein
MSCTLHFSVTRHISKPWEDVHMTPFRTMVSFPIPSERLLSPTVRFWRILMVSPSQDSSWLCPYPVSTMNLQVRGYSQQYSFSGMKAHASNHWMIFRTTTLLNSSPLLVGRHTKRIVLFQTRFSLSPAFADCA